MKGVSTSSQVTSAFYSAKGEIDSSQNQNINEEADKEDTSSMSPTASDMQAPVAPVFSVHHNLEKQRVKRKWREEMNKLQQHISLLDFAENTYVSKNTLNVVKNEFVKEEGRTVIQSSHPPLDTVVIPFKGSEVIASPFKLSDTIVSKDPEKDKILKETKKIISQNNFANLALQTIGEQLDRIEEKMEKPVFTTPPIFRNDHPLVFPKDQTKKKIEKPLISLPEDRPKIDFKNSQARTLDKIDQLLTDLKKEQPSTSTLNSNGDGFILEETSEESSNEESSEDKDIDLIEKNFQNLEIARFTSKEPKPMSLTKN
ncbi:hypothetical protein F2P56_029655, partial [Juglans regia]